MSSSVSDLDLTERITLICKYFCEGYLPGEIQELMRDKHGISLRRETPYRYLAHAARHGWIQFVPPPENSLRDRLKRRYPWLDDAVVAHTAVFDDVAWQAAEMLVKLLRMRCRVASRNEVHVGFAGGHVMRRVAERLAGLLRRPTEGLPRTVVFHALVAGFEVTEPTTAPNAFFTYFVNDPALQVETRFVGLHAPPTVEAEYLPRLRQQKGIKEAFAKASELDVIVTAVGSASPPCGHSMLLDYMKNSPPSLRKLKEAGYCGDMLWRPLGPDGPIEIETQIRAMTLIELSNLNKFIQQGKAVLLVLGPCRVCNRPRTAILELLLDLKEHLITHLVADSRSVAALLKKSA